MFCMRYSPLLLLLPVILLLQTVTFADRGDLAGYYGSHVDELIDLLAGHERPSARGTHRHAATWPDSDPEVDTELWNQLNSEEIKDMPTIEDYSDEQEAVRWLKWYLRISQRYRQIGAVLGWNYDTNITVENQHAKTAQSVKRSPFSRMIFPIAKKFNEYMRHSTNDDLRRIFDRLASGTVSKNDEDMKKISTLHSQMQRIYSTAKVCEANASGTCYTLSPYLERVMQTEKDYDRLVWAWKGWHDACGDQVRPLYLSYIDLLAKEAKDSGYSDTAELWIEDYEMGNTTEFERIMDQTLEEIKPLYEQLHAYVRGRLCKLYPNRFDCDGPIPAHLLGNMWAQEWQDRYEDLIPYPDAPLVDMTHGLLKHGYSVQRMFTTAERFFTSIGLYPMTPKFWARSLFKKPKDRDVVCHAAASDIGYHDDYRVRVCTEINGDYFYTIHHEMGHVEYYMAYDKKQPFVYRSGANSGFHEAIGDTIGMYAMSPSHLVKLGFADSDDFNEHFDINYLMRMALQKVAFLPFGYAMDKYRYALFRDQVDRKHELNSMWWALRVEHGGIMAAVHRSDATNFDAGAKFHVPSNTPYFRYFIAHILQFQFYRAMCRLKGHTGQLHMCDIYGRKDVGEKFREMLSMGNSKSWSEILESLTGETKLEPQAMLDFFQPLYKWLKTENLARGYPVGWMPS